MPAVLCLMFLAALLTPLPSPGQVRSPLEVLVTAPRGATETIDQSQTIFASFNQPMVPLREVPPDEGSGPLVISPPIKGKFRWLGTATIAFIPADTLPFATKYIVTVPEGTASLSGAVLQKPHTWEFETPRPRIIRHNPFDNQRFVELDHSILLTFNQRVDPGRATRFISLLERAGSAVSYPKFSARRPSAEELQKRFGMTGPAPETERSVLITPDGPMKKSHAYVVRSKAGLPGTEGNLGMSQDHTFHFTTYHDLSLVRVGNPEGFSPSHSLRLIFSNPVSVREVVSRLTFDPPVVINLQEYGYDYQTEEVHVTLPLKAETRYTGTLRAGLKDRFGNEIASDTPFFFRTGSFTPFVRMTTGPGVIEAYEAHQYPVRFMNVDSVLLQMGVVRPDAIVPMMQRLDFGYYNQLAWEEGILEWVDTRTEDSGTFSHSRLWHVRTERNREVTRPVDLDELLGSGSRGVVLLQVDNLFPDPDRRYLKALLQVTGMGITAKFSPEDNLIWVTHLRDASPVAGATVEIRSDSNAVLWSGKTDARGLAKSPGWGALGLRTMNEWQQPRQWVIVKKDDDIAFSNSDWQNGLEPWYFGVSADWSPEFEPLQTSLFTDRGLYKAGESVMIKGVVRRKKDGVWRIPQGGDLRLTVRNSRGEELHKASPVLTPFGSFHMDVALKSSATLGYYTMTLEVKEQRKGKESWKQVGYGNFRVEAFRPAEFEVTARIQDSTYVIGDTVAGFLAARYLFGSPLKHEAVSWRVSVSPSYARPDGFDGYFFGPMYWLSRYTGHGVHRLLSSAQETLDDQGSLRFRSHVKVGEIVGTSSLLFEADVTSPSRQVISGRASVTIHGGEYAIGIGPSTTFIQSESTLTYKLVAVRPAGTFVSDVSMDVKVFRRIWRSVRKAESGGRYTWISEEENVLMDSSRVRSAASPVDLSYTPAEPGLYFIEGRSLDSRGNEVLSHAYFYVTGPGYVAWERSNDDRIELVPNRTSFKPGEVASILVKSPYERADALVTIERDGIMKHYTTRLTGSAPQIDIPILSDHLPNIFVSVVLLQGRSSRPSGTGEADVGRPSFKVGYVKLSVSPREKQLTVSVSTEKQAYRPGDSVTVSLRVMDAASKGVRSEVVISVADLGVLNLIGYRLPNLFQAFYSERPLAVRTTETRLHLVEQRDYGEKGEEEGGGGADEKALALVDAEGVRKDFRASAYWNPSVMTDTGGAATVTFTLPDNLTSFQVMAVAHTGESEFGYGENSFAVSKPLLLQPAFPRFVRVGDSFEGGVVMMNASNAEKTIRLTSEVSGLRASGSDSTVHTLKAGQALEVRRRYTAERIGKATFTFRANTAGDHDGLRWTIPIQVPRLREAVALFESMTDSIRMEKVIIPGGIYGDLGDVEFTAASTALVGLSEGISYLFSYPYGCLEQRLSAVLPIILAREMVEAFKLEVYKDRDYRQVVARALEEVPAFQRPNGGFSYWKNTPTTWAYVSTYAMYTLVEAQRRGYPVDKKVMQSGLNYLKRVLRDEESSPYYKGNYRGATRAFILYVLALSNMADHGYMEKLYRERSTLPLFGRAYLLKALSTAGGNPAMIKDLADDLANQAKIAPTTAHYEERDDEGMAWCYHSDVRTTALSMQALVETQPENPVIPKVVRWLLEKRTAGRWRTTQENLYVVHALATYFARYEPDEPEFRSEVRFAGMSVIDHLFSGRSLETRSARVPMQQLVPGSDQAVTLARKGKGRLYYGIRMNYYPRAEAVAKDEGISVLKRIEPVRGEAKGDSVFGAGSLLRVTLTVVTNQDRHFVVVDDPLPGGFEVVNRAFLTTAIDPGETDRSGRARWVSDPFNHKELYDDRVLFFADYLRAGVHTSTYLVRATSFGVFRMPSTRTEQMYEPEVFGQTSSRIVKVH